MKRFFKHVSLASLASARSMFTPGAGPAPIDIKTEIVGMTGT